MCCGRELIRHCQYGRPWTVFVGQVCLSGHLLKHQYGHLVTWSSIPNQVCTIDILGPANRVSAEVAEAIESPLIGSRNVSVLPF